MAARKEIKPVKRITYSPQLATRICEEIASGMALKDVCALNGMPKRPTVYQWFALHSEFKDMYARAREDRADLIADEIITIADTEEDSNKARVRIDARKWWAAKINPKSYGDKIVNEHTGKDGGPIETADVSDRDFARWLAHKLEKAATPDE